MRKSEPHCLGESSSETAVAGELSPTVSDGVATEGRAVSLAHIMSGDEMSAQRAKLTEGFDQVEEIPITVRMPETILVILLL